jgi:MoaA/NifB/PqqE/SkfB family radical SAM enzyme
MSEPPVVPQQHAPYAEVDEAGRLILPAELAQRYGIAPGARLRIDPGEDGLRLHRPATQLVKVYVEPTNCCNLACVTCMRNHWDAPLGAMSQATFRLLLENLAHIQPPPLVFFGGLGEPLAHAHVVEMIAAVKALGCRAELITNGTLLTREKSRQLIQAGLDMLWVSLDGARPESYADVRLGAELPQVLDNLMGFRNARPPSHRPHPQIGIVFVAMRRNIGDLPELLALGKRLRIARFMVSNLLPYDQEMEADILYGRALHDVTYLPSPWLRRLSLPKMDIDEQTGPVILQALRSNYNVSIAGNNLGQSNDVCTFIETGSLAVGWDGRVCPCPPLLYDHPQWIHGYQRMSKAHIVGRLGEQSLAEIWNDPEYTAYRERVQSFGFAPCTFCGGCDLSRENQADCIGSPAPACGACLWAQALIQCP